MRLGDLRFGLRASIDRRRLLGMAGSLAATGLIVACDRDGGDRTANDPPTTAQPQPSAASVQIEVTPETPLIDERFALRVSGLPPGQSVTLRAILNDSNGQPAAAAAVFTADAAGVVGLTQQAPANETGSYVGVDGMDLVWSATAAAAALLSTADRPAPGFNPNRRSVVEIDGVSVADRSITRLAWAPGVQRIEVRESGLASADSWPQVIQFLTELLRA
jgi:hypothetical protein